jgi:hypothetical protein
MGSVAFYQKKAASIKHENLRTMFKTASKNVCTSTTVASPNPLSPTPSTFSAMKTQKTDKYPNDPEPGDEVSKWNTPLISCTAKV